MNFEIVKDLPRLGFIYQNIKLLDNYYPNFYEWYYQKFVIDVLLGKGVALLMKNKYEYIGTALLKNTKSEKKIRAFRIFPKFQNKGYGLYLIDKSLEILDTPKPHCTVAEELINDYARIFINRYFFELDKVERNLYRKSKNEYFFNTPKIMYKKENKCQD